MVVRLRAYQCYGFLLRCAKPTFFMLIGFWVLHARYLSMSLLGLASRFPIPHNPTGHTTHKRPLPPPHTHTHTHTYIHTYIHIHIFIRRYIHIHVYLRVEGGSWLRVTMRVTVTSSLRVRVTIRETLRDTVLSPQIAECQTVLASIVVKSCKDEGLSGLRRV